MRLVKLQLSTRLAEWWPLLSDPADYREGDRVRCSVIDEHVCGLFPEAD